MNQKSSVIQSFKSVPMVLTSDNLKGEAALPATQAEAA
jgi:hypothetical protein